MNHAPVGFDTAGEKYRSQEIRLHQLLGGNSGTTARFNLVRQSFPDAFLKDVKTSREYQGYTRFMVMDSPLVDLQMLAQLDRSRVAHLPLVTLDDSLAVFGIKSGLKPLVYEAFHNRISSATYISDSEIFKNVGDIYKKAWRATGQLLLDSNDPHDSPLDHIALSNFSDGNNFLFLCPPFVRDPLFTDLEEHDATELFAGTLQAQLENNRQAQGFQPDVAREMNQLLESAIKGFEEG